MLEVFIDIETHRVLEAKELTPELQKAWKDRYVEKFKDEYNGDNIRAYQEKSALFPEFSKVICISIGFEYEGKFYKTSFKGSDEVNDVLIPFITRINKLNQDHDIIYLGWNINGFDKPYIIKRLIINNLDIPKSLRTYHLKPWEGRDIDLMNFWKFGGMFPSPLEAVAASLGIKSKSEKFDGKTLYRIPIQNMDWDELKKYCEEDIEVAYLIYNKLKKYM